MDNTNKKLAILGGKPVFGKKFPPYNSLGVEEKKAAMRVMDSGIISDFVAEAGGKFLGGKEVQKFEKMMCRYFKVRYAVSFNSATTALQAAVAALGIGPGDEVITSPYTMSATPSSILLNNAIPVFADIDPDTFSLDYKSIEKLITKRTKAIMAVNIFGGSSDFKNILSLARKHNLKVIEDNAQAIGAKYGGKFLGTVGDIGVFSFNVHKALQCGEGGVLVTNDKKLAFRAQLVRNHGEVVVAEMAQKGVKSEPIIGSNYRLSELHAAIAAEQLKKINRLNGERVALADYLTRQLKKIPWIKIPELVKNSTHVYYVYPFKFLSGKLGVSRKIFTAALSAEGFPVYEGYVKPLYLMPLYQKKKIRGISYKKGICPVAERLHEKELLFTTICQPPQTKAHMDLFIKALRKIESNAGKLALYEKRK